MSTVDCGIKVSMCACVSRLTAPSLPCLNKSRIPETTIFNPPSDLLYSTSTNRLPFESANRICCTSHNVASHNLLSYLMSPSYPEPWQSAQNDHADNATDARLSPNEENLNHVSL